MKITFNLQNSEASCGVQALWGILVLMNLVGQCVWRSLFTTGVEHSHWHTGRARDSQMVSFFLFALTQMA